MSVNISNLMHRIRQLVNKPMNKKRLMVNHKHWEKLCSSMDVVEDCEWAISFYRKTKYPSDTGGKYLYLYGVLQAVFIQQDATTTLSKIFRIEWNKYNNMKYENIREIRNDAIGHPVCRREKSSNFICQASLNKWSFEYWCFDYKNNDRRIEVDLKSVLGDHSIWASDLLKKIVSTL